MALENTQRASAISSGRGSRGQRIFLFVFALLAALTMCLVFTETLFLGPISRVLSATIPSNGFVRKRNPDHERSAAIISAALNREPSDMAPLPGEVIQDEGNASSISSVEALVSEDEEETGGEEDEKKSGNDKPEPGTSETAADADDNDTDMRSTPSNHIKRIILIGERHSGTSFTKVLLEKCFPSLEVINYFLRHKHWFQPSPEYVVDVVKNHFNKGEQFPLEDYIFRRWSEIASLDNPRTAYNDTVLVTMFRNPYDWMEAMRAGPHHWPKHFHLRPRPDGPVKTVQGHLQWYVSEFYPWQKFVASNMTLANYDSELDANSQLCQHAFTKGSATPCRKTKSTYPPEVRKDYASDLSKMPEIMPFSGDNPIYEHDAAGRPYKHPLALRSDKIKDFLDIPSKWDLGGFVAQQQEELNEKGSALLLEQVSKLVGVEPSCKPVPPKRQAGKVLDPDWAEWISKNTDWEAEALVGYHRRTGQEVVAKSSKEGAVAVAESQSDAPPSSETTAKNDGDAKRESVEEENNKDGESMARTRAINKIILIGERHSGTSFTTRLLEKCFPTLEVSNYFLRHKHWFQPSPDYVVNMFKSYLSDKERFPIPVVLQNLWSKVASSPDPKSAYNDTLLVSMFRNPYDWMEAMRAGPHHYPNHFDTRRVSDVQAKDTKYGINSYPWQKFIGSNMTLSHYDSGIDPNMQLCQSGFKRGMVTPCVQSRSTYPPEVRTDFASDLNQMPEIVPFSGHQPVYEHDFNGNPYKHPLALRSDKIKDFLDIPSKWDLGGFLALQQEELNEKGSESLLKQVSDLVGIKPVCEPDPPKHQAEKHLDADWAEWISNNADWEIEGLVGYRRREQKG